MPRCCLLGGGEKCCCLWGGGIRLWIVGQYLLQRPRAALDISWSVHLSQTASATIGTACRNLHPEVDFLQRYCPPGGLGEVLLSMGCIVYGLSDNICEWGKGIDLGINCD